MKNKKSNVGSFATVKLQAKMRSILAIIALVAVIGFSIAACGGGDDGDGNGNGNGNGAGNQGTAPTITTTSLPNGTVGTAYSQTLAATGDTPITWTIDGTGTLPTGLSLAPSTGIISGTPTAAATSTFTVKATNAKGSGTKSLSITIASGSSGGDGGRFTLTDIPAEYNGKYAYFIGFTGSYTLYGCQSITSSTFTLIQISNGSVSMPIWYGLTKYSGNDTVTGNFYIFNSEQISTDHTTNTAIIIRYFNSTGSQIVFSNGNATKSWNDGKAN